MKNQIRVGGFTATCNRNGSVQCTDERVRGNGFAARGVDTEPVTIPTEARVPLALMLLQGNLTEAELQSVDIAVQAKRGGAR